MLKETKCQIIALNNLPKEYKIVLSYLPFGKVFQSNFICNQ